MTSSKYKSQTLIAVRAALLACFVYSVGQSAFSARASQTSKHSYKPVEAIVKAKCVSCHNDTRHPEAVNLTTLAKLLRSGEHGVMVSAGHPEKSKLYLYVDGEKKPRMPFKQAPLSKQEIAAIRDWIKSGAHS